MTSKSNKSLVDQQTLTHESQSHVTVLLEEAVHALDIYDERCDGFYVDGTFGRGGHSGRILTQLSREGQLLAFDKDLQAVESAQALYGQDQRFSIAHESFADLHKVIADDQKVTGILLDLGVSSPQLDEADRGFSFMRNGPLDMRMDTTRGQSAEQWLQANDADAIAKVLRDFGEEKFAWRIAQAIRKKIDANEPLDTTEVLAGLVEEAIPASVARQEKKHPATRTFQALRIAVNAELDDLHVGLQAAVDHLEIGGRLVVISFHSLEDRIVKRFIRQESEVSLPKGLPLAGDWHGRLKPIGRAVKPSAQEVKVNPRSRSAVMRVAERVEAQLPPQYDKARRGSSVQNKAGGNRVNRGGRRNG